MKKLLVIGASGLLGSRIIALGSKTYNIYGTYNTHKMSGKNLFYLDTADRKEVFSLIEKLNPSFVIDTHAMHNVDYCEQHQKESWDVNVEGTRNVAEASKKVGAKDVYISTDSVFDGEKSEYKETDKPHPLNYYAETKWAAELVLEGLGMDYIVIRTAVLYGKGGQGKVPFAVWLIDRLKNGEEVKAVTDQYNNPTLVDNVANAIFGLLDADSEGIFHVVDKDCISRYDFAVRVAKKFGLDSKFILPVKTAELNQKAVRARKIKINTDKVEKATGIKMIGVEEALRRFKEQMEE